MEAAQRALGASLRLTTGPSDDLIVGLSSIGEIGLERSEIDTTTLDSPDDFKEYIGGFLDAGEVAITGILKDNTTMEDLYALAREGNVETFEIELRDGQKWFFSAFVKSFKQSELTVDGVVGFTGSLRVTGAPEYAESGISV